MSSTVRTLPLALALGLAVLAPSACRSPEDAALSSAEALADEVYAEADAELSAISEDAATRGDTVEAAADEFVPDPRLLEGVAAIQAGDTQVGVEILEAALGDLPTERDRADTETWLTHAWTVLGDYEKARDHARAAIELRPEDPWLRYALGLALLGVGEDDASIASLTRSIELDEAPIKALQWRAEVHQRNDRWELALADCDAALEVIATATDAQIAAAGATRERLEYDTLLDRVKALDGLQRYDEAEATRERAQGLGR